MTITSEEAKAIRAEMLREGDLRGRQHSNVLDQIGGIREVLAEHDTRITRNSRRADAHEERLDRTDRDTANLLHNIAMIERNVTRSNALAEATANRADAQSKDNAETITRTAIRVQQIELSIRDALGKPADLDGRWLAQMVIAIAALLVVLITGRTELVSWLF